MMLAMERVGHKLMCFQDGKHIPSSLQYCRVAGNQS